MIRLIFIFLVSLSFAQCSSSKNKNVNSEENAVVEHPEVKVEPPVEKTKDEDADPCYPGRERIKTIEKQEATVVTIIGRHMLVFDYTRLDPCELPEEFAKDDLKVIVSGDTYATPPNVRVAGQPFVIRSISLVEK